ncbi:PREDICTED: sentrin-specific protease 2 isoform X2 [Gekko japonicus]|uniref:Sentrin-specific protease 2 isoform X2 n=1 Tax=Gekko japonicus TaxID=146911 RepID=A0ABM1L8N2_GEKJA|nr:PREDICTED: sentrin-specific protease 2 isoform X2 [Gekko japonicus]
MFKWLPEGLRSWLFPPSSCRREVEPSLPPSRKRRYPSAQLNIEDPDQERTKRQKLGIFCAFTQGIVSLLKLPSQLTAKYFLTGDQHAEATDEFLPNASGTLDAELMEPTSGMQMVELNKKAAYGTSGHPNEEMAPNGSRVMPFLRKDCGTRKNGKTNNTSFSEDLLPWRIGVHRHMSDTPPISTGRLLKKPHYTVEEGVQRGEREKYRQLLEQEKEKSPKNYAHPAVGKHSNVQGHELLMSGCCVEVDVPPTVTPRNGIRSFDSRCSRRDVSSPVIVAKRSSELEKLIAQRKEHGKHPSANDLSEEVLLRLNLSNEGSSRRRSSQVDLEEQKYLSWDKAAQCLPTLTEDMEREIDNVLSHGPEDEVLSSAFKLKITRGDIQTLRNQHWLNDVIINFYMNLLVDRNKRPGLPVLYAFNTFFYPKLNSEGYDAVRKWTKGVDLFQYDMILVPIHIQIHWGLLVVDMRRKAIKYFDSMGHNGYRICKRLLQYLQEESKAKGNLDINASSWTLYSMKPHEIPQQLNSSDCGIFACKYADFISRDKPIMFTQHHMPYFRRRMVWEILHQQLL